MRCNTTLLCTANYVRGIVFSMAMLSGSMAHAATALLADALSVGDNASGSLNFGQRTIALPPGEWRVIYRSARNASLIAGRPGSGLLQLAFDQVRAGRLHRTLNITATQASHLANWIDEPCKTKGDSFSLDNRSRSTNDQFCVRVGYRSGMVDGARGEIYQSWARKLVSDGVGYSPEMPFVSVVRYTPYDFLSMQVGFDPSTAGITKSKRPERPFNDWHPQNAATDTARISFYESLKAWSNTFASAVEKASTGDINLSPGDYGDPFPQPKQ